MALTFGLVKCKIVSTRKLQRCRHKNEIQYHLHATIAVPGAGGAIGQWGTAVNVGTNDSDNLIDGSGGVAMASTFADLALVDLPPRERFNVRMYNLQCGWSKIPASIDTKTVAGRDISGAVFT